MLKANMESYKPMYTLMLPQSSLSTLIGDLFHNASLYRSTFGTLQYLTITCTLCYLKGMISHGLVFKSSISLHFQEFVDVDWVLYPDDRLSILGFVAYLGVILSFRGLRKNSLLKHNIELLLMQFLMLSRFKPCYMK